MKKRFLALFFAVCMALCLEAVAGEENKILYPVPGGNLIFFQINGNLWAESGVTAANVPSQINGVSVKTISFYGCRNLKSVTLPNSLTFIREGAFDGCSALTSVTIPNSVTSIEANAFNSCSSLTSVTIPNSVTSIGVGAFRGCSALTSVTIPNSVTSIGVDAFGGCSALTSVTIPNSVTSIEQDTFSGCGALASVTIPDGVTSIGDYAFSGCSALTSVTIPDSVTSIGSGAFEECVSLPDVKIPDGITSIGNYAFQNCRKLTSVTIPDSVTSIGKSAFKNCVSLPDVKIPDGVTSIEREAFYDCESLTSVKIPDGITSIEDETFQGCRSLTSVTIPDSVTSIGKRAFYVCPNLSDVTIPDGVTSIGEEAFGGCGSLTGVKIPDGIISITKGAFSGCAFASVTIPHSVTSIASKAFNGCRSLTGVTIPDSVASIGDYAFSHCDSLKDVTIPNSVTFIGDYAFSYCNSLTDVTIPDSVTSIASGMFFQCENLTSVTIPDSVTSIGKSAFNSCGRLKSVTIPDGVASIEDNTFAWCNSLSDVTIPDSVTSIGVWAFRECNSLKSVTIPDSVVSIETCAFLGCLSLRDVTIPRSVAFIGANTFDDTCYSLTDIYYAGTEAEWNGIEGEGRYGIPKKTVIHYENAGSNPPSPTPEPNPEPAPESGFVQTAIAANKYCIHVVDENGKPLSGASVTWNGVSAATDKSGNAYLPVSANDSPVVTVHLSGYITWSSLDSGWKKNSNRYTEVILYGESQGEYKLASAYYGAAGTNLLTRTKTLCLTNDGNLIGDFGLERFSLTCKACATRGVDHYELWQKDKRIAQSGDGKFSLSVKDFSEGGGCFVRVISTNGQSADTNINLQFASNSVVENSEISLSSDSISFAVSDDIPFLGGSNFEFNLPINVPVTTIIEEDKIQFCFNLKPSGDDKTPKEEQLKQSLKEMKTLIRKARRSAGFSLGKLSEKDQKIFNQLIKGKNELKFFKDGEVDFIGYAEADFGSSTAKGELILAFHIPAAHFEYNAWVVVVPVTVQVELELGAEADAEISYNFAESVLEGSLSTNFSAALSVFGGAGVSQYLSAGAYGQAELAASVVILPSPDLQTVDLTGELGLKAYVATLAYSRSFAHHTWNLYASNNAALSGAVKGSGPYASLYDASQYVPDDLSYLAAESSWAGDTASLLEALARTELLPLLSDTYRNARPVMVATDNALYAAFVRADPDDGARYVVLTKFDGSRWSEPVRVDDDAILDSSPTLYVDWDTVYLAYARTTENPGDSLLSYALNQEIVVGTVNSDTLSFTEYATFSGTNPDASFVAMPLLSTVNGMPLLAWTDSAVSNPDSVLRPASSVIRYAPCIDIDGVWGSASDFATVNAPIHSIAIGKRDNALAIACVLDEDDGSALYLLTADGQELLAENVAGKVSYGLLPGADKMAFLWNGENVLTSSEGDSVDAPGISNEYALSGNNLYYSAATEEGANLVAVKYQDGKWGLPIQLTDGKRYLENLSVASLKKTDYALGMHTAATMEEKTVEDAKNLVWAAVKPFSDLRLDCIDYDAENAKTGTNLPVTLTVTNAGDHAVYNIDVTMNDTTNKRLSCAIYPGERADIEMKVPVPASLSECLFAVAEPGQDDYSPDNNAGTVKIGYADAAIELEYQQIGTKKALMASVTNQGIEAASGNVAFYDANGSSVAESAFMNLASGDTTIVVYELDENFAGINGGDISAKVTLEQEELYAYNNTDTLHIMEAESNQEKTEIVSAVANGERGISADIACESELTATAYCAFYNSDGKTLSVEIRSLSTGQNRLTFTASDQTASKAKIFVLDNQMIPQCASNAVEIT